jgi:PQQ-dependent dehydrogenase (methanol/ethanol family)
MGREAELRHALAVLAWWVWLMTTGFAQTPGETARGIDVNNAGSLRLVFSFSIRQSGGQAGSPAVEGNLLFLQSPFPHTIYALDLTRPADPVRWSFAPPAMHAAAGLDWYGATSSGPVLAAGRLYFNTFDGRVIALDAPTGHQLWDVVAANPAEGESLTKSPTVADGRVFIGNAGDDFGARGWIEALDAETGAVLWKRFSTGPDRDVGIGPAFKPSDARDLRGNLGTSTWPPGAWRHGGGGLAGGLVYDPATDLLLHGAGHPAPWNPTLRPGENKWTSGLFARDPRTGDARWFVSLNPHDRYAFGAGGSLLPVRMEWHGETRDLLVHPDANGHIYVLDRPTGVLLSAVPFVPVNASLGVDLATGLPRYNPEKAINPNATVRDICPGWPGATGGGGTTIGASAFSTRTHLLYIPVNRLCMDLEARDANYIRGTPFVGANVRLTAPSGHAGRGALMAWDVAAEKPAWTVEERFPVLSGVLVTDGDVVFYGTLDGWFKAVDGRTGRLLWQFKAAAGFIGQPIVFLSPGQGPCVAVLSGAGGGAGEATENRLDIRDATAANGSANALHDLKPPVDASGGLYVFAIP